MLVYATHATGGGVGHDWFEDYAEWKTKNFARVITGIGFCGSTAPFDADFDLYVGGVKMGSFKNLAADAPTKDHILRTAIPVPPNALIQALVTTDTTTNPANIILEFVP